MLNPLVIVTQINKRSRSRHLVCWLVLSITVLVNCLNSKLFGTNDQQVLTVFHPYHSHSKVKVIVKLMLLTFKQHISSLTIVLPQHQRWIGEVVDIIFLLVNHHYNSS